MKITAAFQQGILDSQVTSGKYFLLSTAGVDGGMNPKCNCQTMVYLCIVKSYQSAIKTTEIISIPQHKFFSSLLCLLFPAWSNIYCSKSNVTVTKRQSNKRTKISLIWSGIVNSFVPMFWSTCNRKIKIKLNSNFSLTSCKSFDGVISELLSQPSFSVTTQS